jgi:hypothetical protein
MGKKFKRTNREGEFEQSALYAFVEIQNLNPFVQVI